MGYETPGYNYGRQVSNRAQNKGLTDAAEDYGQFLGQERFRRQQADMTQGFQRAMPKVGAQFAQRGMFNSGLRRQGQRDFATAYKDQLGRSQYDQAADQQQFTMKRGINDATYTQGLQTLFDEYKAAGLTGPDPFAAVRGLVV